MSNINKFKNKINNIITDLINDGSYEDYVSLQNQEHVENTLYFWKKNYEKAFKK